jgi:hypothetical protein
MADEPQHFADLPMLSEARKRVSSLKPRKPQELGLFDGVVRGPMRPVFTATPCRRIDSVPLD